MKRIYDKKFTEHIDKGFDIITMDDYETSKLSYVPKPSNTKWEKLRLTSNSKLLSSNIILLLTRQYSSSAAFSKNCN